LRRLRNPTAALVIVGIAIALLITLFSPFASTSPDGLDRVAEDKAFIEKSSEPPYKLIADYVFPWVDNEDAATILSGVVGVGIVAGVTFTLALGLQRLGSRSPAPEKRRDAGPRSSP
jgi:hypothetical protein